MQKAVCALLAVLALACGGTNRPQPQAGSVGGSEGTGGKGGSPSEPTAEERLRERLTPLLSELTAPPFGSCAAIAAVHGSLEVNVVQGTLFDGGPPAQQDTPFNVASVSKLLTAARVVSLAHGGSIGLDDMLGARLPGVTLIDENGSPVDGVTLRHLLQHQSGLPHVPPDLEQKVNGDWTAPDLLTQLTEDWQITLTAPVGQYQYSNLGYALLGAIVEQTEQCSFATCMGPYLAALGMSGASFWPADLTAPAAHGRVMQSGAPVFHSPDWYGSRYALPFNGLWTSMPALARFGTALAEAAKNPTSELHAMTQGSGHGLGPVRGTRLGASSLEHDGSGQGFYAWLVVIPDLDITLAVATNGGNETSDEVQAFADIVESALLAIPADS